MGEYRPVQSDLEIPFLQITAIQNLEDDIVRIPIMSRTYVRNTLALELVDVVRCLCGIGDIKCVGLKWKKQDMHILTDP
ncbi:hypothetical protein KY284_020265 [Solanum tuberosum]|nr:hypothetical protein KY284_020265 [Solanum tuberosum]